MHVEHNDTMKTSDTVLLEKYTSHFIWKGCVWEGVGDRTELQHIDPHSIGHNCVSFPFSCAAQPGAWRPTPLGAGFLYHILSPTGLVSKLIDFLSSSSYIIVQCPLLLVGVTIALIQPIHSQGYNSDIPRPNAPVIYIGAFPILTARPGRRSIYNNFCFQVIFSIDPHVICIVSSCCNQSSFVLFYFQFLIILHWVLTQDLARGKMCSIYLCFCCFFAVFPNSLIVLS